MNHELLALTTRIDRLERETRRWKRVGLGAALGLAVLGLAAAAVPAMCDIVTGERLVLRDETGRSRFTIDAYRTDTPAIAFQDKEGKVRARLGLDNEGEAYLGIYDAKGNLRSTQRFGVENATGEGRGGSQERRTSTGDPAAMAR